MCARAHARMRSSHVTWELLQAAFSCVFACKASGRWASERGRRRCAESEVGPGWPPRPAAGTAGAASAENALSPGLFCIGDIFTGSSMRLLSDFLVGGQPSWPGWPPRPRPRAFQARAVIDSAHRPCSRWQHPVEGIGQRSQHMRTRILK